MPSHEEQILQVLQEDLMPLEDILACMVARKGLEGIVPVTEKFKTEIAPIWEILKNRFTLSLTATTLTLAHKITSTNIIVTLLPA